MFFIYIWRPMRAFFEPRVPPHLDKVSSDRPLRCSAVVAARVHGVSTHACVTIAAGTSASVPLIRAPTHQPGGSRPRGRGTSG